MVLKRNVGLVLILMGLAFPVDGASTLSSPCSNLTMIPAPYQRNGTVLPSFPLSCNITGNFTSSYSLDFFTLLENEKVPVRSEDYFTVDVFLKCSAPYNLEFSNSSMLNLKMILSLRLEDCHVEWTDIDKLGQSVYLLELALTYIHILPLQTNALATGILPGLDNVLEVTVGINFKIIADVLHIEQVLPIFPNLSAMVLMCYDSKFNTSSCTNKTHRRIQFNTTWLQTTYPDLQTLVLIGVIPSDSFAHLNFPWNNITRFLPLNLSRTSFLQTIYMDQPDAEGHGVFNELRRFLDISNTDITIDRVCPISSHLDKIALRLVRLQKSGFPHDCFWKTQDTTFIDISGLNIESVPNDTFRDMRQLRYLAISSGTITEIKAGTFDDLKSLTFLSLHNNRITHIKKGAMSKLTSLETLYLHNNFIRYIESDSLPIYENLSFIDVRWNHLSALVNDCLKLPKLVMCDLEHNYISLDNFRAILRKEFDPIRLSLVDPYAYEGQPPGHYDEGYIHENDQSHLNLKYNGHLYVHFTEDWTSFEKLQLITLLSWLQIDMGKNHLFCGCPLYNMKQWLLDNTTSSWKRLMLAKYPGILPVSVNNLNSWECGAPVLYYVNYKYVHGPFMKIPDEKFLCRFHSSSCPHQCKCYKSPIDLSNYVNCQNKSLTEIPQQVPIPPDGRKLIVLLAKNHIKSLPDIRNQQHQTQTSGKNSIVPYSWLKKVTFLELYHNQIAADAYSLESFSYLLGEQLEVLKLEENDVQSIPKSFRHFKMLKNLTLPENNIKCCNSGWMKYWLRESSGIIHKSHSIKCTGQNSGLPIVEMEDSQFVCSEPSPLRFLAFLMLIPAIIIPLVCIKHAGEIKILVFEKIGIKLTFQKIARDDSKEYDAVLMYADQDHEWCAQTLLPHLEKGYHYKIFFKHRDGDLGVFTGPQRTNSLVQSCRAIVVLSNSFISDPDCMTFFSEARAYSTDKRFVLVIKLEQLRLDPENEAHSDIFNFLLTNFYVDIKMNRCLARLCYWMPDKKTRALPLLTENLPVDLEESHGPEAFADFDFDNLNRPLLN